ncbi:cytochrome c oxidase subunit I [Meiothermus ruber DSM 1279]|jgi:cytochrome c oxidase subunit 1|uniref:Cytochrome c oxidase subunit I n=2 Tax=Meiothermus ruber (strain ATCC 35948 / DSM 1279 / VKM B-1258 / 21) TaxID=504728 RepID=A0A806CNK8_MEIRD|nr:cbb3-type cytochrome c oxidase subunit I [Meiothermus ruber]ADD28583.1 cytochrome c oxidase subunit I [Meiothermus ruber DSM 1279]MCL6531092.1 cbb3-type cytochrome c oxidase subunit I [Meiothermus ruber]MCX7802456.1 cbb3-type cytochrome c oxidase subunit I [Meiothermus ruber]
MAVKTLFNYDAYASAPEKKYALYMMMLGFAALALGTFFGPLQAMNYGGLDLYPLLKPVFQSYYQGLTLHGVLNAIVFTQLFAQTIMVYLPARELGLRPNMTLAWVSFWMALGGLLLAAVPLLLNEASVLYTFYAPLQAHWAFYLGAAIFVLSSYLSIYLVLDMWARWRKANPGKITPLATFMAVTFWLMWFLASLGLVVEALFLIAWSFGLVAGVDPLLMRTLFWYTGHPIVYFWLLPAYTLAYVTLPRLAGGKLVSDPLARLVFILFLLFSVPVGFHHQFADPGIAPYWKMIHTVLTMLVAVPSLITAFTIAASLEVAGRANGGKGLLGWIGALPWNNPTVLAFLLGFLAFIPGGAGGMVNASFNLNQNVHNTVWIPGHFHLQVGTLVTMAAMGTAFWLIPHLTGKPLVARGMAVASQWLWFLGMFIMTFALHWMGFLYAIPRRAHISGSPIAMEAYKESAAWMALNIVSGVILFIAALLFFYVIFATALQNRREPSRVLPEVPFTEVMSKPEGSGLVQLTERVWFWFGLAVVLVVLAYGPVLFQMFTNMNPVPGQRLW